MDVHRIKSLSLDEIDEVMETIWADHHWLKYQYHKKCKIEIRLIDYNDSKMILQVTPCCNCPTLKTCAGCDRFRQDGVITITRKQDE